MTEIDLPDYGQEIWRKDAEDARTEARRRIARSLEIGADTLDLTDLRALTHLPSDLATLPTLRHLSCGFRRPNGNIAGGQGWSLTDLSALTDLPNLLTLDLEDCPVTDLTPLTGATGLQSLNLSGTGVTDLTPLTGATGLQSLNLYGTGVTDLTPLAGATDLQSLDLRGTGVTDLTPLAGATGLQSLNLYGTGVTDLTPLTGATGLQSLNLYGTGVTDLTPLAGATDLQSLDLHGTGVTDLTPLTGATDLQSLDLPGTGVTDLTPLAGATDLQSLDLRGTGVTDLTPLLQIPAFSEERAQSLNIEDTAAAEGDRRLYLLSRLDRARQAVEVIQYLKGTHPDFRDPPGGAAPAPLAQHLAEIAPIQLAREGGRMVVRDAGPPARDDDPELGERLVALREHAADLQAIFARKNVREDLCAYLESYATVIAQDPPNHFRLNAKASLLKGAAQDDYITQALDGAVLAGLQELCRQHDDLGPSLVRTPPPEMRPALAPEATPDAGAALTGEVLDALATPELAPNVDVTVNVTLETTREMLEKADPQTAVGRRMIWTAFVSLGTLVSGSLGLLNNVAGIATWVGIEGTTVLTRLQSVWETLSKFFL